MIYFNKTCGLPSYTIIVCLRTIRMTFNRSIVKTAKLDIEFHDATAVQTLEISYCLTFRTEVLPEVQDHSRP